MGSERMGEDVPCNIPNFAIMDAGAKWEDRPTDSAQAHMLSLNSREDTERKGTEKQREDKERDCKEEGKPASRDRQGRVLSVWSKASGNMLPIAVFHYKQ